MKKSILTSVLVLSMGALTAQTTPSSTTNDSRTKTSTGQQGNQSGQTGTQSGQQNKQSGQQGYQSGQQNTQPPSTVSTRFSTDYPNTRSNWSMSGTNHRAEYTDPNTKMGRAVIYDGKGNPIGMENEINKGDYPATINEYYARTYPNETYRVWTSEENGKRSYYVPRNSDQLRFDDQGNYTPRNMNKTDSPK